MAKPVSKELMDASKLVLSNLNYPYSYGGTYLAMEGPQFSTYAESNLYRKINCDVIGMTNMPEAKLAREAEIRYCSISMVTDYDCWHSEHDSVDLSLLIKTLNDNVDKSKNFIKDFANYYYKNINFRDDITSSILDTSIITPRESWDINKEKQLTNILKRFKSKQ
jgi:Purine nucleoside phosphorylase